ncbi:MAG: ABC transporter permease [Lachnospiraceae bacterium]|nr:ABC transporter permease [Lachnospiraceae bacterium]
MNKLKFLGRLITADLKRLKNYIVSILIAALIISGICGFAGSVIAKNVYKQGTKEIIGIGYYLPEDGKEEMNNMGITMLQEMESMKSTANLIQVSSPEEGYELLEKEEILYLVIVPEKFISSIMNGTNTPLEIVVWDNSSVSSYIANEMFISYAMYLGLAQSAVYSTIDAAYAHDLTKEERNQIRTTVNLTYLDRALNKDSFFDIIDGSNQGKANLLQHYLASAVMLSLIFMSFVLMPHLQGYNKAMQTKFSTMGIGKFHMILSGWISSLVALYISYLLCFVGISIITNSFNPLGLVTAIPSLMAIGLIISLVANLTGSLFTANMTMLILGICIAYVGGGILPNAMLPSIVQQISGFMPGKYIIANLATALFGL